MLLSESMPSNLLGVDDPGAPLLLVRRDDGEVVYANEAARSLLHAPGAVAPSSSDPVEVLRLLAIDSTWWHLVERLPEPIARADRDGALTHANAAWRRLPPHASATAEPAPIVRQAEVGRFTAALALATRSGRGSTVVFCCVDGGRYPLHFVPELSDGVVNGAFIVGEETSGVDCGARMFRSLVNMSPDLFARYDLNGARTYLSDSWRRLGFTDALLNATPMTARVVDDPAAFFAAVRRTLSTGESTSLEAIGTHPDGSRHAYDVTLVAERDSSGEVNGAFSYARDITRRKDAEVATQAANDRLNMAMAQLVEAEKLTALGGLVAGVAHELNTPLGNALTVATALAAKLDAFERRVGEGGLKRSSVTDFVGEAREAIELLLRSHERAAGLVSKFKSVAVDQASEQRRMFLIGDVIGDLVGLLEPSVKSRGASLHVTIQRGLECVMFQSYPGPLGQALTCLIRNALIHAFPSPRADANICIDVRDAGEGGGLADISVSDDGVGMSATVSRHAFEPFFTTKLGAGGSGLGLTIVRNLVRAVLGGEVEVRSTEGVGTTFKLRLPFVAPLRGGAK